MLRGLYFTPLRVQGFGVVAAPGPLYRRRLKAISQFRLAGWDLPASQRARFFLRWAQTVYQGGHSRFSWSAVAGLLNLVGPSSHLAPLWATALKPLSALSGKTPAALVAREPAWVYTRPRRYILGHWITLVGNLTGACALAQTNLLPSALAPLHAVCTAVTLFL